MASYVEWLNFVHKRSTAPSYAPWRIYNIGSNSPIELKTYVSALESALGKEAEKELLPLQPGDVQGTFADVDDLSKDFDFKPQTSIQEGVDKFAEWFVVYYG